MHVPTATKANAGRKLPSQSPLGIAASMAQSVCGMMITRMTSVKNPNRYVQMVCMRISISWLNSTETKTSATKCPLDQVLGNDLLVRHKIIFHERVQDDGACAVSSVNCPFVMSMAAGFSSGLSSNVVIRPKIS